LEDFDDDLLPHDNAKVVENVNEGLTQEEVQPQETLGKIPQQKHKTRKAKLETTTSVEVNLN